MLLAKTKVFLKQQGSLYMTQSAVSQAIIKLEKELEIHYSIEHLRALL